MRNPHLDLWVDLAATVRLTRLVVGDTFPPARAARVRAVRRSQDAARRAGHDPAHAPLAELVTCPWCASAWVGLGVGLARRHAPRAWQPVAFALAGSLVAGLAFGTGWLGDSDDPAELGGL